LKATAAATQALMFAEEVAMMETIEREAVVWMKDVKQASAPNVEAYRAGCQQGMARLLVELSKRNKIDRRVK
jgi:hypothetical protein